MLVACHGDINHVKALLIPRTSLTQKRLYDKS